MLQSSVRYVIIDTDVLRKENNMDGLFSSQIAYAEYDKDKKTISVVFSKDSRVHALDVFKRVFGQFQGEAMFNLIIQKLEEK